MMIFACASQMNPAQQAVPSISLGPLTAFFLGTGCKENIHRSMTYPSPITQEAKLSLKETVVRKSHALREKHSRPEEQFGRTSQEMSQSVYNTARLQHRAGFNQQTDVLDVGVSTTPVLLVDW